MSTEKAKSGRKYYVSTFVSQKIFKTLTAIGEKKIRGSIDEKISQSSEDWGKKFKGSCYG